MEIKLVRFDLDEDEGQLIMGTIKGQLNRQAVLEKFELPEDSIIKLQHDGKLIPWSMLDKLGVVEIHVYRPHQNVKPQISEGQLSDVLVRRKVKELEGRISSLEAVADPALISEKTDRDLQLLTKQISFLAKRLAEADAAEWIKK